MQTQTFSYEEAAAAGLAPAARGTRRLSLLPDARRAREPARLRHDEFVRQLDSMARFAAQERSYGRR